MLQLSANLYAPTLGKSVNKEIILKNDKMLLILCVHSNLTRTDHV